MKLAETVPLGFLEAALFALKGTLAEPNFYSGHIATELFEWDLVHLRDDLKGLVYTKRNPAIHLLLNELKDLFLHRFYLQIQGARFLSEGLRSCKKVRDPLRLGFKDDTLDILP